MKSFSLGGIALVPPVGTCMILDRGREKSRPLPSLQMSSALVCKENVMASTRASLVPLQKQLGCVYTGLWNGSVWNHSV